MFAASISRLLKPRAASRSKVGEASSSARNAELVAAEVFAERPLVEGELDVEGGRQRLLDLGDGLVGEALGLQRGVVDARRLASVPWPTA